MTNQEVLDCINAIRKELVELQGDVQSMHVALLFYAEERHYQQTGPQHDPDQPRILQDRGAVARAVIEKLTVKS